MNKLLIIDEKNFNQIPNILLDKHEQLGLSELEAMFLIKISRHKEGFKIHDEQLIGSKNQKTAQRRRTSLKAKGLLKWTVTNKVNSDGVVRCDGFIYDLTGINNSILKMVAKETLLSDERTKVSDGKDKSVRRKGQKRPPNNTSYKTIYKTTTRGGSSSPPAVDKPSSSKPILAHPAFSTNDNIVYASLKPEKQKEVVKYFDYWEKYVRNYSSQDPFIKTCGSVWGMNDRWVQFKKYVDDMEWREGRKVS